MTQTKNSFEAGTPGATVSTVNTGGTGNTPFSTVTIGGAATLVFDNTDHAHGTQCVVGANASGQVTTMIQSGLSSTAMNRVLYVKLDTAVASDLYLIRFTVAGVRKASLHINGASKLRMCDSTGTTGLGPWTSGGATAANVAIPLNQWIRVELYAQSAASGTMTAAYYSLDSTSAIDSVTVATANGGGSPFDAWTIGKNDASAYAGTIKYDSTQGDDAATGLMGPWVSPASSPVRPVSVISNAGAYTNDGGAADIPAALADESNTTMATSPVNPAATVLEVKLGPLSAGGNVTVLAKHQATAGSPITRTYSLMQGATTIKSASVVLPTSITDWSMTTTSGETSAITDRSDLRVRISDTV